MSDRILLYGFGITNRAVADALLARGHDVVVVDDTADDKRGSAARARGLEIVVAPDHRRLVSLVRDVDMVVPTDRKSFLSGLFGRRVA